MLLVLSGEEMEGLAGQLGGILFMAAGAFGFLLTGGALRNALTEKDNAFWSRACGVLLAVGIGLLSYWLMKMGYAEF